MSITIYIFNFEVYVFMNDLKMRRKLVQCSAQWGT